MKNLTVPTNKNSTEFSLLNIPLVGLLASILSIEGCTSNNNIMSGNSDYYNIPVILHYTHSSSIVPSQPDSISRYIYYETIIFIGSSGTGKSSLCNTIFQKNVFESGISSTNPGERMTKMKQGYILGTTKYIDTPGLDDPLLREKKAREIEQALKENSNYKIVFIATLESGRIRAVDLDTINTVCKVIETPFEYGLIFNKVSDTVLKLINKNNNGINKCLECLTKKPKTVKFISHDDNMADKNNVYFPIDSQNYKNLISFIQDL